MTVLRTLHAPRARRRACAALLLVALGSAIGVAASAQAPSAPTAPTAQAKSAKLDRAAVDALLARPGTVLFVDVRRPDELTTKGGFPVYLSVQSADLEKYLDLIPRERTVVTVSNHAARALKAADLLAAHGFHVAGAVGVENYEAEGGSLLRVAAPTPKAASAASVAPAAH